MHFQNKNVFIASPYPAETKLLTELLSELGHQVVLTKGSDDTIHKIYEIKPDIILIDAYLPDIDGYETCKLIKEKELYKEIPIIFILDLSQRNSVIKAYSVGGSDYVAKPMRNQEMLLKINHHLNYFLLQRELKNQVDAKTQEVIFTREIAIKAVAGLAETRDPETAKHLLRTQLYVKALADELAHEVSYQDVLSDTYIRNLYDACPLHDIGKVGIPDNILLKGGRLTPEEYQVMKKHTEIGYLALQKARKGTGQNDFFNMATEIIRYHHERYDGAGYPEGLAGEGIPLSARLMSFADVYDALRSRRVYKQAFSHEETVKIMFNEMKGAFDPKIIKAFMRVEDKFIWIANEYRDEV